MSTIPTPRYFMGKCSLCAENLFFKEEAAAHLMNRLREIESVCYSSMAFGAFITLGIYEEGGQSAICAHELKLTATFNDKDNKVQYLREQDAK